MNTHFPDAETVRTVLTLAVRAPSIHNTQPWRWRVCPTSLELFSRPDMQLRSTDPDGRELILSCGVALHHCVVALASLGWQAKVKPFPRSQGPLPSGHHRGTTACSRSGRCRLGGGHTAATHRSARLQLLAGARR